MSPRPRPRHRGDSEAEAPEGHGLPLYAGRGPRAAVRHPRGPGTRALQLEPVESNPNQAVGTNVDNSGQTCSGWKDGWKCSFSDNRSPPPSPSQDGHQCLCLTAVTVRPGFPRGLPDSRGHSGGVRAGFPDAPRGDLLGRHSPKLGAQRPARPRLQRGSPRCGDSGSEPHRTSRNHQPGPRCRLTVGSPWSQEGHVDGSGWQVGPSLAGGGSKGGRKGTPEFPWKLGSFIPKGG